MVKKAAQGDQSIMTSNGTTVLLARLEQPETVENLNRLLDKLDVLTFALEAADGVIRRGDTIADSLGASFADARKLAGAALGPVGDVAAELGPKVPALTRAGVDVARLAATDQFHNLTASGLLERLGEPRTIESLHHLLNHLELLAMAATMLDGFLRRGEELMDNLGGLVRELQHGRPLEGIEADLAVLKDLTQGLMQTARDMQRGGVIDELPKLTATLVALLESGVFDPSLVKVLAEVGKSASASYQQSKQQRPAPLGPWGLLQAMSDPDVQKSFGFLVAMARNYGKTLQ